MKKIIAFLLTVILCLSGLTTFAAGKATKEIIEKKKAVYERFTYAYEKLKNPLIDTIFGPYINAFPTNITPAAPSGRATEEVTSDGVTVKRFTFDTIRVDGTMNTIYAVMAIPKGVSASNPAPAIMWLHGGGGSANDAEWRVIENARNGYVSFTYDAMGWCPDTAKGPGKTVWFYGNLNYMNNPYSTYVVTDGAVTKNSAFGSIVSGLMLFNYVSSQGFVDEKNMGIYGESWGGYNTTILSSLLGRKVKAAYSIYGSGYWGMGSAWTTEGDVLSFSKNPECQTWLKYLDAGNYARNMKANFFIGGAVNDGFFHNQSVVQTLKTAKNSNHAFSPNSHHNLYNLPNYDKYSTEIFDYYLKGEGYALPELEVAKASKQFNGSYSIILRPKVAEGLSVNSIKLYYNITDASVARTEREWLEYPLTKEADGTYTATFPAEMIETGISWFANAEDNRFGEDGGLCGGTYVYDVKSGNRP